MKPEGEKTVYSCLKEKNGKTEDGTLLYQFYGNGQDHGTRTLTTGNVDTVLFKDK